MLALNSLRVHSASVNIADGVAIDNLRGVTALRVAPRGRTLRQQFILALDGDLDVMASLDKRDRDAQANAVRNGEPRPAVPVNAAPAPSRVLWRDAGTPGQYLVEIRTTDRRLLAMLTGVFERGDVNIDWAKITTLGSAVVDVFGISLPEQSAAELRESLERDLNAMLPKAAPAKPQRTPTASG